jgi:hypothetical protein
MSCRHFVLGLMLLVAAVLVILAVTPSNEDQPAREEAGCPPMTLRSRSWLHPKGGHERERAVVGFADGGSGSSDPEAGQQWRASAGPAPLAGVQAIAALRRAMSEFVVPGQGARAVTRLAGCRRKVTQLRQRGVWDSLVEVLQHGLTPGASLTTLAVPRAGGG